MVALKFYHRQYTFRFHFNKVIYFITVQTLCSQLFEIDFDPETSI